MKKIFITGAAGFIGSHLSERLFLMYKNTQFILFDKITYITPIAIYALIQYIVLMFYIGNINITKKL